MKLFFDLLFFVILCYFMYQFIQVLIKMKQPAIIPSSKKEIDSIRSYPQREVQWSTYSAQKIGIITQSFLILVVIIMFLLGVCTQLFDWSLYFLIFLPLANSYNMFNLFAVIEDGLLSGNRFIAWRKIKSFRFVPIDINHKYYGYSKEANEGYELKIKTTSFPINCVITSEEMKDQLTAVLNEQGKYNNS